MTKDHEDDLDQHPDLVEMSRFKMSESRLSTDSPGPLTSAVTLSDLVARLATQDKSGEADIERFPIDADFLLRLSDAEDPIQAVGWVVSSIAAWQQERVFAAFQALSADSTPSNLGGIEGTAFALPTEARPVILAMISAELTATLVEIERVCLGDDAR